LTRQYKAPAAPADSRVEIRAAVAEFNKARVAFDLDREGSEPAYDVLSQTLYRQGFAAVIVGGKLFSGNVLPDEMRTSDDPFVLEVVDTSLILNLGPPPPLSADLEGLRWMIEKYGRNWLFDRIMLTGPYQWVMDAINRFGHDALNAGRLRGVLVDRPTRQWLKRIWNKLL
jgi:hypothetical protein